MDCFTNYVFISDKKIDCERFIKQLKTWMINNNNKKDISFKNLLSKANLNYKLYDYTGEISYISNIKTNLFALLNMIILQFKK